MCQLIGMGQLLAGAAQEEEFPWFQILQWATEDLNTSEIFTYDLVAVRKALENIWASETNFANACKDAGDLRLTCDEDSDEEVWLAWAAALLEKSPSLAALRFSLVPRKMAEEVFWAKIFASSKKAILLTI